jgi:serine/threonine-protein kinase HipA
MSKPMNAVYVFASHPDGSAVLAGRIELSATFGSFTYSEQWLQAHYSYALDPVNLPLSERRYTTHNRNRVFGVFTDAGPDDWGTKVMLIGHSRLPANELERLLACSGHGVGCLKFSLSRTRPKLPTDLPPMSRLSEFEQASRDMAEDKAIPDEVLRVLAPGTSMGGARPKVSVADGEQAWLAKFSLPQDAVNMPLTEHATLQLAARVGIQVPENYVVSLGNHHALLVKRFDRGQTQPIHFISARSLFNRDRIKQYADAARDPYSYPALARVLRAHARNGLDDCRQLYRRMVFNTLIGNTDDHAQNHALVYDVADDNWRLSPAYDLIPIASANTQQALGIGKMGRESSVGNLLSIPEAFDLNTRQTGQIIQEQIDTVSGWKTFFADHGVPQPSLAVIEKIVQPKLNAAIAAMKNFYER